MNRLAYSFFVAIIAIQCRASTITAASTSSSDVQSAINSAAQGDTVVIPIGTNTWTSGVTVAYKSLTVQSAAGGYSGSSTGGFGSFTSTSRTVLTNNIGVGTQLILFNLAPTNFVTVKNLDFASLISNQSGNVAVQNPATHLPFVAIRFTGCVFYIRPTTVTVGYRALSFYSVYGLVDNCYFRNVVGDGGHGIDLDVDGTRLMGTNWHTAQFYGDTNTLCIETCTFDFDAFGDNSSDCYNGAKFVIRHCVFTNTYPGWHGADSGPRGVRMFEVYNNWFYSRSGFHALQLATARSGSGVLYSNIADSGWNGGSTLYMRQYRASADYPQSYTSQTDFLPSGGLQGPMNGSRTVDGNFGANGYPGLDQIGRGSFTVNPVIWTSSFATNNYEPIEGVYMWSNNINGNLAPTGLAQGFDGEAITNIIMLGRDYYDNTPKPGYSALVYPHPLLGIVPPPPNTMNTVRANIGRIISAQ